MRILWLEPRAPALAKALLKLEKGTATKAALRDALQASAKAIGGLLSEAEAGGKLKSARRGVNAFFGYTLAHEAHHRGQILLHLKTAGMRVDPALGFSLWEWEKI